MGGANFYGQEKRILEQPHRLESCGPVFLSAYCKNSQEQLCFICGEKILAGERVALFCNFPRSILDLKLFFSHIRCLTEDEIFYISRLFQIYFVEKLPALVGKEHEISQYIWTDKGILMEISDPRNCQRMPLDKFLIRIQFYCNHCQLLYDSFVNLETGHFEILPANP
jgi:hypothetical protein